MARSDQSAARDGRDRRRAWSAREGVILVAAGVALLCVAAWSASRAKVGDSSPDAPTVNGSEAILNDALLVAGGALLAIIVIFVVPAWLRQGRGRPPSDTDDEPRRFQFWLGLLGGVAVLLAITFAILVLARDRPEQLLPPLTGAPATTEPVSSTERERAGARGWAATALFAAGAVAVGVVVLVWYRRGRGGGALDVVDDVEGSRPSAPPDLESLSPADAVRAAYAAARTALAPLGVWSRAPETPYEYLDRVRATAPGVESQIATLTRLFEVARFSHHPVTPAMKAEAIAAYHVAADEARRARESGQTLDDDVRT